MHSAWRVAVVHPDPEPIVEVVRAFQGFSPVLVVANGGLPALDEDPAVWIAHRNYLLDDSFLSRHRARAPVVMRRSLIVSLRCLKAVESRGHGELTVTLKEGRRIPVGPTYRRAVEQLIESGSTVVRPE